MRSYYDMKFGVRPGWTRVTSLSIRRNTILGTVGSDLIDSSRWPSEPHVALANLNVKDVKTLAMFTRVYGPLIADVTDIPEAGDQFEVDVPLVGYLKQRLIDAWRAKDAKGLWVMDGVERYDLALTWSGKKIQLAPADVFTYSRLLLTRDISEKRARVCANEDCIAPYFIAKRSDQIYCEWKCANLIMQRNFRKRRKR